MRYKSVLEMVWKSSSSLSFKIQFTWQITKRSVKMFWKNKDEVVVNLHNEIACLKIDAEDACRNVLSYKNNVKSLKEELEDLKSQKKREMQEVEHLVKMSKEKNEIEFERKVAKIENDKVNEIATIQKDYYEKQQVALQEIYGQIMKRLPDVNMHINHDTGTKRGK